MDARVVLWRVLRDVASLAPPKIMPLSILLLLFVELARLWIWTAPSWVVL